MLATALLAGMLVSPAAPTASAGRAPENGRILFTRCSHRAGCQIYTVNPDGSARRKVTNDGDNFEGDWSPDGTKIAYVGTASGDLAIWIVDADGGNARQLTPDDPGSNVFWPRFSPDGEQILFTDCAGDDCDGGIGSVRPDGTDLRFVTPNSHDSYNLADLSPSGARMVYMRWHIGGVKIAIYVSRADGTDERRISPPRLQGWGPDWSPAGGRIVFASQAFFDRPVPALYTVRSDGTGLRELPHARFPHADWDASYSPDGERIIFNSDRRYSDLCCGDLFTMDSDGGDLRRVELPFDAYEARWGTAALLPSVLGSTRISHGSASTTGSPCDVVDALRNAPICPTMSAPSSVPR